MTDEIDPNSPTWRAVRRKLGARRRALVDQMLDSADMVAVARCQGAIREIEDLFADAQENHSDAPSVAPMRSPLY